MLRTILSLTFLLTVFSLLGPRVATSQQPQLFQELGAFAFAAGSDHRELPGPVGYGAQATWEAGRVLMFRLSYHRASEESRGMGTVCDQYAQRINCRPEMTETSATLAGVRGGILGALHIGEEVRLGLGGGLSFNHVDAESVGESGLRADLLAPNAGQVGYFALFSAAVTPFPVIPVRLNGGVGIHWVAFNTCSGEDPPQYDPFCETTPFREIELGLSYTF